MFVARTEWDMTQSQTAARVSPSPQQVSPTTPVWSSKAGMSLQVLGLSASMSKQKCQGFDRAGVLRAICGGGRPEAQDTAQMLFGDHLRLGAPCTKFGQRGTTDC